MIPPGGDAKIVYAGQRRCFYRSEAPVFTFHLFNYIPHSLKKCRLVLHLGELPEKTVELEGLGTSKKDLTVEFPAGQLKHGWYELRAELFHGRKSLASDRWKIGIAPDRKTDGIALWHWPATVHYNALEADEATAEYQLDLLQKLGYDWAQLRAGWALFHPDEAARRIESAMMRGIELGLLIENTAGGMFRMQPEFPSEARLINFKGETTEMADIFHPAVADYQRMHAYQLMRIFRVFPSCTTVFMNSEVEDRLKLAYNPATRKLHEKQLGFSLDKLRAPDRIFAAGLPDGPFVKPGVIRDDDPEYVFARYYFQHGDGFTRSNTAMSEIIKRHRPDIRLLTDPMRNCAVFGRFAGMDAVSSWTYTNPDPKLTLFVETLRCAAEAEGKEFVPTITLWNYAGTLVPSGKNRFAREQTLRMEPDRFTENAWINFSRGPLAIGTYFGSPIEFFYQGGDPFIYSPETEPAIADFANGVLRPCGALMRKTKEVKRDIAVLDSLASRVYGVSPRPLGHYPNYSIYCFYTLLAMAHLPADVLFEESVERNGLDGYKILVLPFCDTLPEGIYRKICEFAKRGGLVIGDQYLRAEIPGAVRFDFDFTYRRRVNANAISRSRDFKSLDDTAFIRERQEIQTRGVPADEDQKIMESYAAQLRKALDGKYRRKFDCSSPRVLLDARKGGNAFYLTAVNDHRTWGTRVAKWRAMLEKGLPEKAVFTLRGFGKKPMVFELMSHRRIPVRAHGTDHTFEYTVPAASGAIFAVYPEQPEPELRVTAEGGKLRIDTGFHTGFQPLRITITLPDGSTQDRSGYYTAEKGKLALDLQCAVNEPEGKWTAAVFDLTTGKTVSVAAEVRRK